MEVLTKNDQKRMDAIFTIIVPIYNEVMGLERLATSLSEYLKLALVETRVLFVDDGSTDGSRSGIKSICKKNDSFSYLFLDKNYGLSAAIKAGIDHVQTPLLGYIDADLQTDPQDFNVLLPHMENYEIVTGVRAKREDSLSKRLSSRFANSFRRLFTNDGVDDTGCPLKILRTDVAKAIPMFSGLHRFLPAMVLLQGGKVLQLPVRHYPRITGTSKFNTWNRLLGPLADCFVYLWMKRKYIQYRVGDYGPK
ncbi:glycosyltransferase [Sphingobacterium deserti]|uniref:Glycosyl transferase family 2 n=1 Tax=Sphingobacterium deserti TaxID=1229276 RepID=A0A0B8SZ92_9SPHI|nr:glycosyltransferase [Sphingobacterium deserti]KGE12706.1 glycosyl transferase family 2 [Sphingobacterium deserti]